jgi:hypothetical protein
VLSPVSVNIHQAIFSPKSAIFAHGGNLGRRGARAKASGMRISVIVVCTILATRIYGESPRQSAPPKLGLMVEDTN